MFVKVSTLLEYISEFNPINKTNIDKFLSSYSLLNHNTKKFRTDCLYIGKTSSLPPIPPSEDVTFLLVKDVDMPAYNSMDTKYDCIFISEDTNIWELFNKVQDLFIDIMSDIMYVSDCCRQIIELSNSTDSIQKMLDLGYELLGNPLLLVDASLNLIAHAGGNTVSGEPSWNWILSNGYMPDKYIDSVLLDGIAEDEKYPQKPLILWQKNYLNHDQLAYRILINNVSVKLL